MNDAQAIPPIPPNPAANARRNDERERKAGGSYPAAVLSPIGGGMNEAPQHGGIETAPCVAIPPQLADTATGAQKPAPALSTPSRLQASEAAKLLRKRRISGHAVKQAKGALRLLDHFKKGDRRRAEWQFMDRIEADLLEALGGREAASPQQAMVCRMAARSALLLEIVEQYINDPEDGLPSPINRSKRALFPIVLQRQNIADSLLKQLQVIGLHRVARKVSLADYAATLNSPPKATDPPMTSSAQVQSEPDGSPSGIEP